MSLYREPGQVRRRRQLWIGAGLGALVAIVVAVVLLAGGGGPPSRAERTAAAKAAADRALNGLELVEIEYAQAVKNGQVVAPTEYEAARADVQRARSALSAHEPGERIDRTLAAVAAAVENRVPAGELERAVAEARAAISQFP